MRKYEGLDAGKVVSILMNVAQGIAAVSGCSLVVSDLAIDLGTMRLSFAKAGNKKEYYFAFREMGVESGTKKKVYECCKHLGYPIVIAKVEQKEICMTDYDLTLCFSESFTGNALLESFQDKLNKL